ncbi:MAG TPA: hypothetical protein VLA56_10820 [Pseudomonadales bacterium]|nr:hypothetical protein [Pseudomonadales bacterium]
MNRFLPLLAALATLLTACAAPSAPGEAARASAATAEAAARTAPATDGGTDGAPDHVSRAVETLLRDADQAQLELRLTTPADDNALDRYLHVLVLAPGEQRARAGIDRIAATYRDLAEQSARGGNEQDAHRYLDLATQVAPDAPELASLSARVEAIVTRPVRRVDLDARAVDAGDAALAARLAALGTEAKDQDLFVVIRAPRDDWRRWIYRQMNDAPPQVRLRARSEVGPRTLLEFTPNLP